MHRVYVAWDVDDAKRFVRVLLDQGIVGRVIEDREYPERGEGHDTEGAPEVWIIDAAVLARALELAAAFEAGKRPVEAPPPDDADGA